MRVAAKVYNCVFYVVALRKYFVIASYCLYRIDNVVVECFVRYVIYTLFLQCKRKAAQRSGAAMRSMFFHGEAEGPGLCGAGFRRDFSGIHACPLAGPGRCGRL